VDEWEDTCKMDDDELLAFEEGEFRDIRDYAHYYYMTCCQKRPNTEGCTLAAHKPFSAAKKSKSAKRARRE
jgi:hypothetical protein